MNNKRQTKILEYLGQQDDGAPLVRIARECGILPSMAEMVLNNLVAQGLIIYNKQRNLYSQGITGERVVTLPPSRRGSTCAFDGYRDAVVLAEYEGRMLPACAKCAKPEDPPPTAAFKASEVAAFEKLVKDTVARIVSSGEEPNNDTVMAALGMDGRPAQVRVARVMRKLFPKPAPNPVALEIRLAPGPALPPDEDEDLPEDELEPEEAEAESTPEPEEDAELTVWAETVESIDELSDGIV